MGETGIIMQTIILLTLLTMLCYEFSYSMPYDQQPSPRSSDMCGPSGINGPMHVLVCGRRSKRPRRGLHSLDSQQSTTTRQPRGLRFLDSRQSTTTRQPRGLRSLDSQQSTTTRQPHGLRFLDSRQSTTTRPPRGLRSLDSNYVNNKEIIM